MHSETVEALQDMAHNMEADTDTDTTAECKCGCQFLVTEEEMVAGMKAQASANEGRGER